MCRLNADESLLLKKIDDLGWLLDLISKISVIS